jgi:hypothetical protein
MVLEFTVHIEVEAYCESGNKGKNLSVTGEKFCLFLKSELYMMKKHLVLIPLFLILTLATVTSSSCKKKTDPVPDYPQLIGHWAGTTSQGTAIRFTVDNLKGNLNVTRYDLTVMTTGGYQQYRMINSNGIAYVTNRHFRIPLGTGNSGEAFIDGNFDVLDMTLDGNFAVYKTGDNTNIITGNYNCNPGD